MSVYDFTVKDRKGKEIPLSNYKGKVLLIVNTATGCGFTPQYAELQEIYAAHQKDGLEILDFPCNQFGNQAPGSNDEIHTFCTGRFGITFPQFGKIEVNGPGADPLYQYLTGNTTFAGFDDNEMGKLLDDMFSKADPDYKNTSTIKWNFTKFLIDRNGEIVARFEPTTSMDTVREKTEAVL
ncbi:MAG: glutathione peroxidase [Oscillibacter sp.]|nr:glutathione peroxidase [Oscillibacter sp.]